MKINVAQVKEAVGSQQTFNFFTSAEKIAANGEHLWLDTDSDIEIRGEIVNNGRVLEVKGIIKAIAKHNCNRCLEDYTILLEIPFSEEYQQGENEITTDNLDLMYYEGDEIDIADLVRESILLAEPLKTICKEDCRGLCQKCGTNLNIGTCSCNQFAVDPRLAALQKLLPKK